LYVLGINGTHRVTTIDALPGWSGHDAAAVLVKDGKIIAAIEKERIDRIKHSNHFPLESIRQCLRLGQIGPEDLDVVAINSEEEPAFCRSSGGTRSFLSALFQQYVGNAAKARFRFVNGRVAGLVGILRRSSWLAWLV
jgi:predicted NodU family carbamoyl transferase